MTNGEKQVAAVCETNSNTQITQDSKGRKPMSAADIRHNMIVLVMIDAIWLFGWTEMAVANAPLYVHLKMSKTLVGFIGSLQFLGLVGVFLSPFITRRFRFKKVYLLAVHIPYIGPWGLIGLALLTSHHFHLGQHWLVGWIVAMNAVSWFFGGFCTLPHQEYIAACVPMSHRGRLSGYGNGIGSGLAIISNLLATWVLYVVTKPMAYGYLYVLTWTFAQAGYVIALFARERPTPVEKSPAPWSKEMLVRALRDKTYMRVIALQAIYYIFVLPAFVQFVSLYGFDVLKMRPWLSGPLGISQRVVGLVTGAFVGLAIDRFSPKRFLQYLPLVAFVALLPLLIWRQPWTVFWCYGVAIVLHIGQYGSFNALVFGLPSPENRAGHYTVQILEWYVASSLGFIVTGALCDRFGYLPVFGALAAGCLLLVPISKAILAPLSAKAEDYS